MTGTDCVRCGRPTPDGFGCVTCRDRAVKQLAEIAELAPEARDVANGQIRHGGGSSANKPGSRPPLNFDVLERLDEVTNDLQGWVRAVEEDRGSEIVSAVFAGRMVPDPLARAAMALSGQMEWLRHRPFVDEALDVVAQSARKVAGIVNGPTPGRYAGPCSRVGDDGKACGQDVTARAGAAFGTCKTCGSQYNVDEQQAWMRGEIEGYLARPVEIAGMLLQLGFPVGYSTIASYAAKGQLTAHGTDEQGHPLYRIGDVIDLRLGAQERRVLARRAGQS